MISKNPLSLEADLQDKDDELLAQAAVVVELRAELTRLRNQAWAAQDLFRTAREYYKRPSLTRRNEVISAAYRWAEHDAEVQR